MFKFVKNAFSQRCVNENTKIFEEILQLRAQVKNKLISNLKY